MKTSIFLLGISFFLSWGVFTGHFTYGEEASSSEQKEKGALSPQLLNEPLNNRNRLISMTIITEEDIQNCIGCDLMDLLEQAGVQVRKYHTKFYHSSDSDVAFVGLRGVSDTQTLLLVDGVRQEDKMLSEPIWTLIPVHHIQRIEIIKGPQSAYYGDSAIGGVVHIFTKKADCPSNEVCAEGIVQLSNESSTGHTFYKSISVRTDQSGIKIGFQGDESQDKVRTNPYKEKALTINFDHQTGDEKWFIEGSSVIYDSYSTGRPPLKREEGESRVVSLGTTYYVSPDLLFKILLGHNREAQIYSPSRTEYKSQRLSLKLFGEYHFEFSEADYKLTAGVEREQDRIGSKPQTYHQRKRNTDAVFANISGEQGPFLYQVAVRMDELSGETKEKVFTWNGSAAYHITEIQSHDIFLRVGAGKGFRAPGFDEKIEAKNPDLNLEKATNKEIGLRIEKGKFYFLDIATFKTNLKDPVLYTYNDQSKRSADIEGVEVELGFSQASWSGKVRYSYVDTDHSEKFRAHNPVRHLGSVKLEHSISSNLTVGGQLLHRGEREDKSFAGDNVNILDIYSTYDVNENIRVGFSIRNVTDKKYDQYNNTEGQRRTVWFTLTSRF